MCGIAGIIHFDGRPVSDSHIKAMTDALQHRGPDDEGQYIEGAMGLGHRRLAILDLTAAAHQPMQTEDQRYTLTYNGEIYNFKELRIQLEARGHQFHSQTDAEVVLKAYAEWQEDCLQHFNGMFAFVIWDSVKKVWFMARDRYGIKPLYFYRNEHTCMFASEVKALMATGLYRARLDQAGLIEYLTFQNFFSDATLFQDVTLLKPGHCARLSLSGELEIHQYWDFRFTEALTDEPADIAAEVARLFEQAVQRQLVSDVPVNAYLSGGIDSSSITMVARRYQPNLKNFTIGFDISSAGGLELSFDERAHAERISYLAQTEHYEMVLKSGDMERCMPHYVWHLEEPRVGQSYPNYYATKLAGKFGKVVLSGCGGDEIFAGYPWRYSYQQKPVSFDAFIDHYYTKWQRLLPPERIAALLEPLDVDPVSTRDIFADVLRPVHQQHLQGAACLHASLYLEAKTFLPGLLLVEDKLSMAHSLETRVPFLDNDLVDFATQIPAALKVNQPQTHANENDLPSKMRLHKNGKLILRQAFQTFLDDAILNHPKQGFSSPDAAWFKGESIDFIKRELSKPHLPFRQDVIDSLLHEHVQQRSNNRLIIWSLTYLNYFARIFLS